MAETEGGELAESVGGLPEGVGLPFLGEVAPEGVPVHFPFVAAPCVATNPGITNKVGWFVGVTFFPRCTIIPFFSGVLKWEAPSEFFISGDSFEDSDIFLGESTMTSCSPISSSSPLFLDFFIGGSSSYSVSSSSPSGWSSRSKKKISFPELHEH